MLAILSGQVGSDVGPEVGIGGFLGNKVADDVVLLQTILDIVHNLGFEIRVLNVQSENSQNSKGNIQRVVVDNEPPQMIGEFCLINSSQLYGFDQGKLLPIYIKRNVDFAAIRSGGAGALPVLSANID